MRAVEAAGIGKRHCGAVRRIDGAVDGALLTAPTGQVPTILTLEDIPGLSVRVTRREMKYVIRVHLTTDAVEGNIQVDFAGTATATDGRCSGFIGNETTQGTASGRVAMSGDITTTTLARPVVGYADGFIETGGSRLPGTGHLTCFGGTHMTDECDGAERTVSRVPPADLLMPWAQLAPQIRRSLTKGAGDTITERYLYEGVMSGALDLWVVHKGIEILGGMFLRIDDREPGKAWSC